MSVDTPEYETMNLLNYGTEPDLVAAGIAYAQAAIPQWQPRVGNTELVLMEALALKLGVEVMAIQMLPEQILEQLMTLYGVTRDPGLPSAGKVRFTVTNSAPMQEIPAGTRLRYTLGATMETLDFVTQEPLTLLTSEQLTGVVSVLSELPGVRSNGLPTGTALDVVDNLSFIETAVLAETMGRGVDVETDAQFYSRAASVLSRLTSTLVLPEHFQYAAVATPGIGRARVLDLHNPAAPTVQSAGHVTIAVADIQGEPLDEVARAELAGDLKAQALASLTLHLIDPTYTTVDLAVKVKASFGFTAAQVEESVRAILSGWLNPASWDWSSEVGQYAVVSKVASAAGVAEILSVPATTKLAGTAPLPRLGKLTVTVTLP